MTRSGRAVFGKGCSTTRWRSASSPREPGVKPALRGPRSGSTRAAADREIRHRCRISPWLTWRSRLSASARWAAAWSTPGRPGRCVATPRARRSGSRDRGIDPRGGGALVRANELVGQQVKQEAVLPGAEAVAQVLPRDTHGPKAGFANASDRRLVLNLRIDDKAVKPAIVDQV